MQILLSCAKDMAAQTMRFNSEKASQPLFQKYANELASYMAQYDCEELGQILKVNSKLAHLNWLRFQNYTIPEERSTAALAFTGMAYKHLKANSFTKNEMTFAQNHLWITSFLYGILRPLDEIKHHRLEGYIRLTELKDQRIFDFWKPILTDTLIQSIKQDDGILLNLASEEMKELFDWKRVKEEINIIEPQFMVKKDSQYKTIVVYAKMCRGAMSNYVITNKISSKKKLINFEYEGFVYEPSLSSTENPVFVLE